MKWLSWMVSSSAIAAACSAPPSRPPAAAPSPPLAPPHPASAPGRVAPEDTAGLYWRPYTTCDECDPPAALVLYRASDERTARAIVAGLDGKLGFGLPFVVHGDELALAPPSIAVVAGAFSTAAAAEAARVKLAAIAGASPIVHAVDSGDDAMFADVHHYVTVIDRGGPTPAWSAADAQAVIASIEESDDPDAHQTMETQRKWVLNRLAKRAPACTLQPGELFVVDPHAIRWYELAPVRCSGQPAYVPWNRTTLGHAAIVRDGNGYRMYQVVGAECDSPIIESWRYDASGRRAMNESTVVASAAGC